MKRRREEKKLKGRNIEEPIGSGDERRVIATQNVHDKTTDDHESLVLFFSLINRCVAQEIHKTTRLSWKGQKRTRSMVGNVGMVKRKEDVKRPSGVGVEI